MNDFCDEQKDNGILPCIIPTSVWGYDWANGVDWTSAVAIIPWEIYRFYGDTTLLRRMYGAIKKYVSYIESISTNHLTDWGLGDWVPVRSKSNITLTSSIYYYTDVCILAKAARLFGYAEDASYYNTLAQKIKEAINTSFLNKETGIYAGGTQTELAMPRNLIKKTKSSILLFYKQISLQPQIKKNKPTWSILPSFKTFTAS